MLLQGGVLRFKFGRFLGRKKYPQLRNEFVKRSWKTVCWANDFLTAVNESQVLKMMSKTKAERFEDIFVRTLVSWHWRFVKTWVL